jgi:hypothetical protein
MASAPVVVFDATRSAGTDPHRWNWGLIVVLLGCLVFWSVVALGVVAVV